MKYLWNKKNNGELIARQRPSFEQALEALATNTLLIDDSNPVHPGPRIYVVEINGYPHVIPYEIRGDVYWLITVFPARKYKR